MTPIDQSQLRPRRQRLLQRARGRVLELGGAGGVNLEHYPADRVSEVVVVGADGASRARLRRTAARRGVSVDLRTAAQVGTGYDTVVAAFTLSALSDLDRELDALRQLLAPDGRLLFLDHSPRRPAGVATELSRPLWRLMADGFVPGRDLPGAVPALRAHHPQHRALRPDDAHPPATVLRGRRGTAATTRRRPQGEGRPVTGTLALIGGGDFDATDAVDRQLLARSGGDSVLVLPTADAFEHPERSVTRAEAWFAARGGSARGLAVLARPDAFAPGARRRGPGEPVHVPGRRLADAPALGAEGHPAVGRPRRGGGRRRGGRRVGPAAMALCDPMTDPRGGAFTLGLGLARPMAVVPGAEGWSHDRLAPHPRRWPGLPGGHPGARAPPCCGRRRAGRPSATSVVHLAGAEVGAGGAAARRSRRAAGPAGAASRLGDGHLVDDRLVWSRPARPPPTP